MKGFKSKGFVLSFGEIMLPMIGIVAMALLLVAGKLFFFSGSRSAAVSLPIIKEAPAKEAMRDKKMPQTTQSSVSQSQPAEPAAQVVVALPTPTPLSITPPENFSDRSTVVPRPENTDIVLAVPYKPKAQVKPITAPVTVTAQPRAQAPAQRAAPKPAPQPSQTQSSPVWMVQIGAFSTVAAANTRSKELASAGYSTSVVSGAKWHRVLVRGGATRASASAVAAKIGQGAFVVPPDVK